MFNKAPTQLIASWSENGTDVTFPIASVPELTAAEADASTGDLRKVSYAIAERIWQWWNALAVADRPTNMTVSRGDYSDPTTGNITKSYTLTFKTVPTGIEVVDEPT